ncbi:hypothetical protein A9996_11425 [Gelidibacter algens]|nr:hypothetical protein A9996_11425 [Gelidibacter algens]
MDTVCRFHSYFGYVNSRTDYLFSYKIQNTTVKETTDSLLCKRDIFSALLLWICTQNKVYWAIALFFGKWPRISVGTFSPILSKIIDIAKGKNLSLFVLPSYSVFLDFVFLSVPLSMRLGLRYFS